jgi:phage anti-repressor protein
MMLSYVFLQLKFYSYSNGNRRKSTSFIKDHYSISFSRAYNIKSNSRAETGKHLHRYFSMGKTC